MNPDLPWVSQKTWAIARYGFPIFRIPVDPGWGCPNRDPAGKGGCTFCAEDGGRARQLGTTQSPEAQVHKAVAFARERYGATQFQLYLQAYTATHTDTERLRGWVENLLTLYPFHSISLGTRPDCLSRDNISLLREWAQTREVWVELGMQTSHDATLRRIRRGHSWARSLDAVHKLHRAGIHSCAHLLFGLPGESEADMLETAGRAAALPLQGWKLHNLHILRNAPLGKTFQQAPFPLFSETDYLHLLPHILRRLPPETPVFRLVTDSPPEQRLAPPPEYPKGRFLHLLAANMRRNEWRQGDLYSEELNLSFVDNVAHTLTKL